MQAPQERPLVIGKSAYFEVRSLNFIKVIIPHFIKYPLMTQNADFLLFKPVVELMNRKEHPLSPTIYSPRPSPDMYIYIYIYIYIFIV